MYVISLHKDNNFVACLIIINQGAHFVEMEGYTFEESDFWLDISSVQM